MRLRIVGRGLVGPFGGWHDFQAKLAQKDPLFATDRLTNPKDQGLDRFVSPKFARRLDHFTKMTLLAGHQALRDMKGSLGLVPARIGIVLATGYGPCQTSFDFLNDMIDYGPNLASPLAFSHSVHNVPAGMLAMSLGVSCPCLTLCQPYSLVSAGLVQAWAWLNSAGLDCVLFGVVDEDTRFLRYCTQRLHPKRSLDSLLIQEGALFFCLSLGDGPALGWLGLGPGPERAPGSKKGHPGFVLTGLSASFPGAAAFELAAILGTGSGSGQVIEPMPDGQGQQVLIERGRGHGR
jgi:3-oxoacyl-[acyl-carrier-protein] synthase II